MFAWTRARVRAIMHGRGCQPLKDNYSYRLQDLIPQSFGDNWTPEDRYGLWDHNRRGGTKRRPFISLNMPG